MKTPENSEKRTSMVQVVNARGKFDFVKTELIDYYIQCGYVVAIV